MQFLSTLRHAKPTIHQFARIDLLALLLIVLVSAAVRLAYPEVIGFRQDQADLVTLARDMVEGKSLPLLGIPSSARIPNSPVTVYFVAIPYLFSDSPVFATMFIAVWNVFGVGLLWLFSQRYFGSRVALIAGLAYAVHPWAVGYSRSIWAQDYHTPFFLLAVLFGMYGFIEGKRWGQTLCLPFLLIAMQIHIAAWLFAPIYLWFLWGGRKQLSRPALVISAALGAVTLLPFALGIAQVLQQQPSAAVVQAQERTMSVRNLIKPYGQMVWLATGLGLEQYTVREEAEAFMATAGWPTYFWVLQGAAVLAGAAALWLYHPRFLAVLIYLWTFLPMIAFTVPIIDVFPHYFVPCIPTLCLLAALGVDWLLGRIDSRSLVLRGVVWAAVAAVLVSQAWFYHNLLRFIDTTYTSGQFGAATPIHYLLNVRQALEDAKDVVVIGESSWLNVTANGSRVWASLLRGQAICVRDVFTDGAFVVLPKNGFVALFAPRAPEPPFINNLYRSVEPITVQLRAGEGAYSIHRLSAAGAWSGYAFLDLDPVIFTNGVALTGYVLEPERIVLRWQLPAPSTRFDRYKITFTDESGTQLGVVEAEFWPGFNWCEDDTLISWIETVLPQGAAQLTVTMVDGGTNSALGEATVSLIS